MSSPLGEVTVKLRDGREVKLQFDYEAFVRAEKSVPDARMSDLLPQPKSKAEEARPPTMEAMRAMVQGALHRHHPDITPDELGRMMLLNMAAFADAMKRGMVEAFGAAGDADGNEEDAGAEATAGPLPPTRGTGTRSRKRGRG